MAWRGVGHAQWSTHLLQCTKVTNLGCPCHDSPLLPRRGGGSAWHQVGPPLAPSRHSTGSHRGPHGSQPATCTPEVDDQGHVTQVPVLATRQCVVHWPLICRPGSSNSLGQKGPLQIHHAHPDAHWLVSTLPGKLAGRVRGSVIQPLHTCLTYTLTSTTSFVGSECTTQNCNHVSHSSAQDWSRDNAGPCPLAADGQTHWHQLHRLPKQGHCLLRSRPHPAGAALQAQQPEGTTVGEGSCC